MRKNLFIVVISVAFICVACRSPVPLSSKDFSAFSIVSPSAVGTIDQANHLIIVDLPLATPLVSLVASFTMTGAAVTVSGAPQTSGATENDFSAPLVYKVTAQDGSSQEYTVVARTARQTAYLKASNPDTNDQFGDVSISGDTMVVGAPSEASSSRGVNGDQADNSAPKSGAAYVFVRNGDSWRQQAYLKASNAEANDSFGYSVAISGDTIVVGAFTESSSATGVNGDQSNNSAEQSGAAYVFVRNGDSWSQQAYLKASNTGIIDTFGTIVAISGDTAVICAPLEMSSSKGVNGVQSDNSAIESGAAYVFVRTGSSWSQQAYLKASNTAAEDQFGSSAAISGDTIVIGARCEGSSATGVNGDQDDDSAPKSGAAYVFVRNGGIWSQQAYLKASNAETRDYFGSSLAISGDTIAVGACGEGSSATRVNGDQSNNGAPKSGAAYVFARNGSAWTQQAYLKAVNAGADDNFGSSLSISGDIIAVGAVLEDGSSKSPCAAQADNDAVDSGAAYIFARNGGSWRQQAYLKASNAETGDYLGCSIAVYGETVAVSTWKEDGSSAGTDGNQSDNGATDSGAVYVFE